MNTKPDDDAVFDIPADAPQPRDYGIETLAVQVKMRQTTGVREGENFPATGADFFRTSQPRDGRALRRWRHRTNRAGPGPSPLSTARRPAPVPR